MYAIAVLALFLGDSGDLPTIAFTFTAAYLLAAAVSLRCAVSGLPPKPPEHPHPPVRKDMVRFGLESLFGSASPLETFQLDQAIVGLFISPVALGLYVVGLIIHQPPPLRRPEHWLRRLPSRRGSRGTQRPPVAMWRFVGLACALCGAIVVGLEATVGWLLPLFFGERFSPAVGLSRILLISALLSGARRVLADGARGAGYPGLGAVAEATVWISLLPAAAALAPASGAKGVAIALVVATGLGLGVLVTALFVVGRGAPSGAIAEARTQRTDEVLP